MTERELEMEEWWGRVGADRVVLAVGPFLEKVAELEGRIAGLERRCGTGVNYLEVPAFAQAEVVVEEGDGQDYRFSE